MPATHSKTYAKAAKNGQEVLEMLIKHALTDGKRLPTPKIHTP